MSATAAASVAAVDMLVAEAGAMPTDPATLTPPDGLTAIGFKEEDSIEMGPIGPVYWICKEDLTMWRPLAYLSNTPPDLPHPEWFTRTAALALAHRLAVPMMEL